MATARKTVTVSNPTAFAGPAAWGAEPVTEVEGLDLTDKKELLGVPFLITSVKYRQGSRGIEYVDVDAMHENGATFSFNDSSEVSGVRPQIEKILSDMDLLNAYEAGELVPLRIAVWKGLRVSPYTVTDPRTGKETQAKSYYLTASGRKSS